MRSLLALLLGLLLVTHAEGTSNPPVRKQRQDRQRLDIPIPESEFAVRPRHPGDDKFKLKTGLHGEYLGASRGSAQTRPTTMHSIPVPGDSFAPLTTIKAAYAAQVPAAENPLSNENAVIIADCQFKTKKPAVNLANFPQITDIKCSQSTVSLTFASDASAAQANDEWTKAKTFTILVPRHVACNGVKEVSMRDVLATKLAGKGQDVKGQIVFTTTTVKKEDVIDEFEINVQQYLAPGANGQGEGVALAKRWFWDWSTGKQSKWSVGINADKNGNVAKKSITLVEKPGLVRASCEDCFVHGSAQLGIYITGSFLVLHSYEVELSGELKGSIGLKVAAQLAVQDAIEVTLFSLPLTPVSIPGVLTLGPELQLKAAAKYNVAANFELTAGASLNFPFKWTARSGNGLFSAPITSSEGKPSLHVRPVNVTGELSANVEAHLIPAFVLGLTVWRIPALTLDFEWDSGLGVDTVAKGNAQVDPRRGGSRGGEFSFALQAYHEHELTFGVKSFAFADKEWTLWSSGKKLIPGVKYDIKRLN